MQRDNFYEQLNAIWVLLNDWRRDNPEGDGNNPVDKQWALVCQAMGWIQEDLEAAYNAATAMQGGDNE